MSSWSVRVCCVVCVVPTDARSDVQACACIGYVSARFPCDARVIPPLRCKSESIAFHDAFRMLSIDTTWALVVISCWLFYVVFPIGLKLNRTLFQVGFR